MMQDTVEIRRTWTRPLSLSISVAVLIELVNFAVFGYGLNAADASHFQEFVWTVGVGGLGMGALLGALINLVVTQRLEGREARSAVVLLAGLVLGIISKFITVALQGQASLLDVSTHVAAYVGFGLVLALVAGALLGMLLYTRKGHEILTRIGL